MACIGAFIIWMLTVSVIEGFLCFREEEKQRYTNNSESATFVSDEKLYTDIFACGDENGTYLKRSCLICGRVSRSPPLCPNGKDEPNRHLTCSDCEKYSNACQNSGTPYCPQEDSYASSMSCRCQDGYNGTFCEKYKVYRQCTCNSVSRTTPSVPPCDISGQPQCYIVVLGGNSTCVCEDTRSTDDMPNQSLPNCKDLPANITVEVTDPSQSPSQSENTESKVDKYSLIVGIVLGAIFLFLALVVVVFVFFRRRRRNPENEEPSVRFENLSYAIVNQTDTQRPPTNANEMNRLYDEVPEQVDHGVNYYSNSGMAARNIHQVVGATGGDSDCGDTDENLKKAKQVNVPVDGECCSSTNTDGANNEMSTSHDNQYIETNPAGTPVPKQANLYLEAHREIDSEKPSNLQLGPVYNNWPRSLPLESTTPT